MTVTVKYGKNTTKDVPAAYQYFENPKIIEYSPRSSFLWCVFIYVKFFFYVVSNCKVDFILILEKCPSALQIKSMPLLSY